MRVQFTQEGARPGNGKLLLDGYDASHATRGFRVHSSVNDITTVTLDLVVLHGAELDLDAEVIVPSTVAALLVEFGWTPPSHAEERGGAIRLVRKGKHPIHPDALEMKCSCAADAWDPYCVQHVDMGMHDVTAYGDQPQVKIPREMLCVCATDSDAPESCYVHGRVHRRS